MAAAKEVMHEFVCIIDKDDLVHNASKKIDAKGAGYLVVMNGDSFHGMITQRDIRNNVTSLNKDPNEVKVADVMSHPIITMREHQTLQQARDIMTMNGIKQLPIIANSELVGMIRQEHIE